MTLRQYIEEDGTGPFKNYLIPDLLPRNGQKVDLLLVLESPHRDELRTGLPLAGDAGQRALSFLAPAGDPPEALGPYVSARHANGDTRIGIVNVSPVPLQKGAFAGHRMPPALSSAEWKLLEAVRSRPATTISSLSSAAEADVNQSLHPSFSARLAAVRQSPPALVFIAGTFVHRTWNSIGSTPGTVLPIPHPSNGWWARTPRPAYISNLNELVQRFAALTQ